MSGLISETESKTNIINYQFEITSGSRIRVQKKRDGVPNFGSFIQRTDLHEFNFKLRSYVRVGFADFFRTVVRIRYFRTYFRKFTDLLQSWDTNSSYKKSCRLVQCNVCAGHKQGLKSEVMRNVVTNQSH